MTLTVLLIASCSLALLVARWLYLERRFARPAVPGRDIVRVVGRLQATGQVEVIGEGTPPFDLILTGPVEFEADGKPLRVLTDDAVLDAGFGPSRGLDLPPGRLLTIDGEWVTVPRDGLYREAGREVALDALRVVLGARPGLLCRALPVLLAGAAAVASLGLVDPLPSHMRASADALQCSEGAQRVSMTYSGNRGWVHACTLPDETLHGPWTSYYGGGLPWRRAVYRDGQLHGTEREWFPSGRPKLRTDYRRGRRHGLLQVWHPSGQLQLEGRYRDGRRQGEPRRPTIRTAAGLRDKIECGEAWKE